jgi:putative two-component system response regulator
MITFKKSSILIVEDSGNSIDILLSSLKDLYELTVAINGYEALDAVERELPDLILLDVIMPGISGYEVCNQLKSQEATKDIPIIFLTSVSDVLNKTNAFELGAADYLTKPFDVLELKARVKNHLELKHTKMLLADQNKRLEQMVIDRTEDLYKTQSAMIYALAFLTETRDSTTGEHIKRTQIIVETLAISLRDLGYFQELLTDEYIHMLYSSAPLHDIGKVGVSDEILLKPGKLTYKEFEAMKLHTLYGYNTLVQAEKEIGDTSFLKLAKEITYTHHEKWDGSGYPQGLSEEEIPISGRLMALVDVYDALVSARPYKEPYSHETAKSIILKERGHHFDPIVVDAFLACEDKFIDCKS